MSTTIDIPAAVAEIRKVLAAPEWGVAGSDEHSTALVLLVSAYTGPSVCRIAKATGLPHDVVAHIGTQARRQKIWRGRKVFAEWADEDSGSLALACDAACTMGLLTRK